MGCRTGHIKFFRFRTPITIEPNGVRDRWLWMVQSLQYIDFNYEVLIKEVFRIGTYTPIFSYTDLKEMTFDQYEIVIKEAIRMHKASEVVEDAR